MRKIKITALLLAVLMIVTAFAGCASKSTVTNLDNKVNDLDASIEEQKAALSSIESTLATISKALENQGSSDDLDEVIKDIEKNEQGVADLKEAISDLKETIEDLHKAPETEAPSTEDLKVVINQYSAKLEALEGEVEDDKGNYTPETLAAIRELIGDAETAIAGATDKAAAEAAYKAVADKLADKTYMSVNGKLYAYIVELKGNITDDSAEKVDDAMEALDVALKFYEDNYKNSADYAQILNENVYSYKVSKTEYINLEAAINDLHDDQYFKLPALKAEAEKIEKQIDDIDATYTFAEVTAVLSIYRAWEKDAKALSPVNLKYVENYDALIAAHTSALNSDVAKTIFDNGKVDSLLYATYGADVDVFNDYVELLKAGKQVLFVFGTEKKYTSGETKEVNDLTSKIYDVIDAWVADWAKEYNLTDVAITAIIDAVYGENFYAKYNSDKALVKAFEAESKKLADGVFKNIKALNNKRVGADAMDVLNSYKQNAADINNWRDALVAAYAEELRAIDNEKEVRNIWNENLYKAALTANFNAMVDEAELCVYDDTLKDNVYYGLGFIDKLDSDKNGNAYYHKLYDFKNDEMVKFLRVTFKEAQGYADIINKRIENYKAPQAHSIADLSVNIGGYVAIDGNKLVAIADTDIRGEEGRVPDTIAEFVYDYKTNVKYDLSGLLDIATYEAKLAEIEKNVKAADAALEALDAAYGEYLNTDGLVTMSDYAQIVALYGLFNDWMEVGHVDMALAVETNTTPAGVKEYKLVNIFDRHHYITNDNKIEVLKHSPVGRNTLDADTGIIVMTYYRAKQLKKEADLAVSAYEMMDKVYNFHKTNSFSFDNNSSATVPTAVLNGVRDHFASSGVVSVTCSEPMTEGGFDSKGRTYLQGQSLWTVEYVVIDSTPKFTTAKLENYYFNNYDEASAAKNKLQDAYRFPTATEIAADPTVKLGANAASGAAWNIEHLRENYNVQKDLADKMVYKEGNTKKIVGGEPVANLSTLGGYVDYLFETLPESIRANDISQTAATFGGVGIPNFVLPIMAMHFEGRFMVDNYKEAYADLTAARANWDPVGTGAKYGYTYIQALSYAYVDNYDVKYGQVDDTSAENKEAVKLAKNIDELRVAIKACLVDRDYIDDGAINVNTGVYTHRIIFGEAFKNSADIDADWMTKTFDLAEKCDYIVINPDTTEDRRVNYLRDFDLEDKDFYVEGLVIYKECDHVLWQRSHCTCQSIVCDECSKLVRGTACVDGHKEPAVWDHCKGTTCELCGECEIAPEHTFHKDYIRVETLWVNHGNGVNEDFDHKELKYIYGCVKCDYTKTVTLPTKDMYIYECSDKDCEHKGACSSIDTGAIVRFQPECLKNGEWFIATYHKDADVWHHFYELKVESVALINEGTDKIEGLKLTYQANCPVCGNYFDEGLVGTDEFTFHDLDGSMTLTTHDRVTFTDIKELLPYSEGEHDFYYHESTTKWEHNYDVLNIIVEDVDTVIRPIDNVLVGDTLTYTYDCAECVEDYLGEVTLDANEFLFTDVDLNNELSIGDKVEFITELVGADDKLIKKTATYHGEEAGWKHVYNADTIIEDDVVVDEVSVKVVDGEVVVDEMDWNIECDVCDQVNIGRQEFIILVPTNVEYADLDEDQAVSNLDELTFSFEFERVVYDVKVVYHEATKEWIHDLDDTDLSIKFVSCTMNEAGADVANLEMTSLTYAVVCADATCVYGHNVTITEGYTFNDNDGNGVLSDNDTVTFTVTLLGVDHPVTFTYSAAGALGWN